MNSALRMVRLPALPRRVLAPRQGESLRDAELRWQAKADPIIAAHFAAGSSKRDIAAKVGVSTTAILGALRRFAARCKHCGGTGVVVYEAGGSTQTDECGCPQGRRLERVAAEAKRERKAASRSSSGKRGTR